MRLSYKIFGALLAISLAAAVAFHGGVNGQAVSVNSPKDAEVAQLRQATLGFIQKGQWDSASAGIEQLLNRDAGDSLGLELRRLMAQHQKVQAIRDKQRDQAYRQSTAKIAGLIAEQKWEEALGESVRAADLAPSKADLQKQPWFATLVDKNVAVADGHRDKGEWLKATPILAQLASLYEQEDNPYRQQAKKIGRYARLEATYRDADEVARQSQSIDEGMMATALQQIQRYYVTEPNYKKMSLGGIDYLLALTEVPALTKSLPSLADDAKRKKMAADLATVKDNVSAQEQNGLQELARAYMQAKLINEQTVKLPDGIVIREFLEGALEPLDPFSAMIWPVDMPEFKKQTEGEFSGVGIQISMEDGLLTVVSPLEDTPAYKAGIQAGDVITAIDGEPTAQITLNQAVQRIQGKADTAVVLTIRRATLPQPRDYRLIRARIVIKTVKGFSRDESHPDEWHYLIDPDPRYRIGYVRITNYMRHTVEELEKALDAMATQNVGGLIIDLRFNPGGLLDQAIEMSDVFIDKGVLVSTEGRAMRRNEARAHESGTNLSLPIVVLVNEYSASAAEIVSGALKDTGRAVIVGERTFGKGSVQNVIPIGGDKGGLGVPQESPAYLKLTTAHYFLPSGRSLHRNEDSKIWGVEPTVAVPVTRDEIQDIIDLRRTSDVIHLPGEETPATGPDAVPSSQPDRVQIDPQLEAGLLILRAELLKRHL